ncbi:hypothetical protein MSAN_00468400 [Mycena sanguinolenta]|uniref:CNH domain-containing protein n=1 Tax=Mycena sanguinolenta TaxID=230812 RepID=A0A8H6ZE90_9AGAR|nr:hypothetical protein MSAN_00468400 [Mycena sanguinolenta]
MGGWVHPTSSFCYLLFATGTAQRVAFHAPYILLFDTRFIEVRDIETGRLAQIIPGNDMHCLCDGSAKLHVSLQSEIVQEARVYGVMNDVAAGLWRYEKPAATILL